MSTLRTTAFGVFAAALAVATPLAAAAPPVAAAPARYAGPCDASAAIAIGTDRFVVGNDETNTLYFYRRDQPRAIGEFPLTKFLGVKARDESDIEAAAAIGQRIYWITSHARNSKGKVRQERRRFFATDIGDDPQAPLAAVGKPYTHLQRDMIAAPQFARYHLDSAAHLAPEAPGGFNIEGLAATPTGSLLIGLRNPLADGRAIVIPFDNPEEVVTGGARAQFGTAYEFDLGGRGVRSMELIGASYLIVAGPIADAGTFAMYRWSGARGDAPQPLHVDTGTLRPEAMIAIPGTNDVQLFSDDGGVDEDGKQCKDLEFAKQSFRTLIVTPPR